MTSAPAPVETSPEALRALFDAMRAAFAAHPYPGAAERRRDLARLGEALRAHQHRLTRAISEDFGQRSVHETAFADVMVVHNEIRHARWHLRRWMRTRRVATALQFLPATCHVTPQPKGVAGIIAPWNFPLLLALEPLVNALAAGNRVMLKLSESVPRTAEAVRSMLSECFPPEQVAVVLGGVETGRVFSRLPFDHLMFTGDERAGREVLAAAAANLTPVTLELGGKTPALIAPDFSPREAAEKIIWLKLFNAGQTCVTTDYVLLPRGMEAEFTRHARAAAERYYPHLADNPDYAHLISKQHAERLREWVESARARGAAVLPLVTVAHPERLSPRCMVPVLVTGAPEDSALMTREIFGPVLPLVPYGTLDEALEYVRTRPRPLAFNLFTRSPPVNSR